MTERWQRELKKLGGVDAPVARMRAQIANGPSQRSPQPEPGRSPAQRITAGVVAFAVFAAAGLFAWKALRPGGSTPGGTERSIPTLDINLSKNGPANPSPGDASGGAAAFSANLRFGDLGFTEPPAVFGDQPLTAIKEPFRGMRSFTPLTPALTAGSYVNFQTDATRFVATIRAANATSDVTTTLSDVGQLPTDPGLYLIVIHATWPDGFAEWYLQVSLVAPGTMQLWHPDISKTDRPVTAPDIVWLAVDGRVVSDGFANSSTLQDAYPPMTTALEVHQGAPITIDPSVTPGLVGLSWVESASPHSRLGTVDLFATQPTLDAPVGTYYLSLSIQAAASGGLPAYSGDLVFPIIVIASESLTPAPQPVVPGVRLDFNTTAGTADCPGSPEATITYGDQTTKGAPTSFTWTCPGSSMVADTIRPSFSDAQFVQVPVGTRLVVSGDLTAAEGNLQSSPGDYPWTTLHALGDLGGGVDLSFDPGRYVIEVTAHWPNGAISFYFPIELVPSTSPTPPPAGVPDVLNVNCDSGPSIADPTVAVQADGLHIRMVGAPPSNEQVAFYGRDDYFVATTGVETFSSGTYTGEFTRSAATGVYDVKCFPKGADPATINAATTVRVVDPNHVWVSTGLGCPVADRGALSVTDGSHPTEEAAVRALDGVVAPDTVEPAGYTQDLVDRQRYTDYNAWRVVRDGVVVAWTWVAGSQGSWQAVHGVGCISAGTGHPPTGPSPAPTNVPSP